MASSNKGKGLKTRTIEMGDLGPWTDHCGPSIKDGGSTEEENLDCGTCALLVKDDDEALCCDICDTWYHIKCENVSKSKYSFLQEEGNDDISWHCKGCSRAAKKINDALVLLQRKQEQLEVRVDHISQELDLFKQEVTEKIADEVQINMEANIKAEFKSAVEDAMKPLIRDVTKEINERERRKKNVMMFNVKESSSDDVNTRKEHDSKSVKEICKELGVDKTTRVVKSVRIGPRPTDATKPRPLKVELNNEESKQKLVGKSKNLSQSSKEELTKVFVTRDLTPTQREELKEMLNQKETRKKASKRISQSKKERTGAMDTPPEETA